MLNLYPLPYPEDALRPWISEETMNVHYNKHYKGYYDKTIEELQRYGIDASLEEIIEQNLYEKSKNCRTISEASTIIRFFGICFNPKK